MAEPLRHRQTKEAATDMFSLQPPRHIPTLPLASEAIGAGGRSMSAVPPIASKFCTAAKDAKCQSTKSLRDSGEVRLVLSLSPGERSRVAGEAPCLEDGGVNNLIKTGVAYDNQSYHPAASAYDRRYECAQALRGHAARPHPRLQAVRWVSEAISRDGHVRGHPPVPAALGRDRREHLHAQLHHDRAAVLVPGDAAAIGPGRRDVSPARTAEDPT